jgi:hypothetical protein
MREAIKRAFAALLITGCMAVVAGPLHAQEHEDAEEAAWPCIYCLCSQRQHENGMCQITIYLYWTCFFHVDRPCVWLGDPGR